MHQSSGKTTKNSTLVVSLLEVSLSLSKPFILTLEEPLSQFAYNKRLPIIIGFELGCHQTHIHKYTRVYVPLTPPSSNSRVDVKYGGCDASQANTQHWECIERQCMRTNEGDQSLNTSQTFFLLKRRLFNLLSSHLPSIRLRDSFINIALDWHAIQLIVWWVERSYRKRERERKSAKDFSHKNAHDTKRIHQQTSEQLERALEKLSLYSMYVVCMWSNLFREFVEKAFLDKS